MDGCIYRLLCAPIAHRGPDGELRDASLEDLRALEVRADVDEARRPRPVGIRTRLVELQPAVDAHHEAASVTPPPLRFRRRRRAPRELHLECSQEALVAFHNEKGFQAKDLYAMCQVGASSKPKGSGKIGRKGIGFKSVFQVTDCPVVLSPPFRFCFDVKKHDVFGYIVP